MCRFIRVAEEVYQYTQAIGDFTVGILAADGSLQVTNRTINALAELLGPEEFARLSEMGLTLGDMKLVPKSNVSIVSDVISAKAAEIKA